MWSRHDLEIYSVPFILVTVLALTIVGCATSTDVIVDPMLSGKQYRSAYLVAHADSSSNVDASTQNDLLQRGFTVEAGAEGNQSKDAELLFKYTDYWY
jgi:hypothetical protein